MRSILFIVLVWLTFSSKAQNNSCKLNIGTNLSGLSDWMTEMPFVDLMHHSRTWGTRNRSWIGGSALNHWNTNLIDHISCDQNGYPLELPFYRNDLALEDSQMVFTVWAILDAWKPGRYTFLYDGEGDFEFRSDGKIVKNEYGRAEVQISPSKNSFLELVIKKSKKGNHLRNFRLIMPEHEISYREQPFNPEFLEKIQPFSTLRFMDWGSTNNWGENSAWLNYDEPQDTILVPWNARSKTDYYTWAHNKGVPYELMCKLCNQTGKDMWVCVPHNASNEYITEMARLIKSKLNPELKVYTEYSNEVWNWMFGQTQWLNKFYCVEQGISWPEGIVSHIQRNLDIWNQVFSDEPERLVTVAGGQTSWMDVTKRIVLNLKPGSFDALNITGYFGLGSEGDAALDKLGTSATVSDLAFWVRKYMYNEASEYVFNQFQLAKQLNVPVVFYEAGQHITPHPFGVEPLYANALLNIHLDTSMYNLYHEWFDLMESVINDNEQCLYMNFSFVGARSARYGSWGILETLDQDTAAVYAPKYKATIERIQYCEKPLGNSTIKRPESYMPKLLEQANKQYSIVTIHPIKTIHVYSASGKRINTINAKGATEWSFSLKNCSPGVYLIEVNSDQRHLIKLCLP